MKLNQLFLATTLTFFFSISISPESNFFKPFNILSASAQDDSSIDHLVPEGLKDPQLRKAFASLAKLEGIFYGDGFRRDLKKKKKEIFETIQKAEAILREREQKTNKSQKEYELVAWGNICSFYQQIDAWENAVEACKHSFDLKTEKRLPKNGEEAEAWSDLQLVNAYMNIGSYDKAIKQLNQSVEIAEKFSLVSEPYSAKAFFLEVASVYLTVGKYSEAVKYYRLALDSLDKINNGDTELDIFRTKEQLGLALLKNNNLAEAERSLLSAMESSDKYHEKVFANRNDPVDLYEVEYSDNRSLLYYYLQELRVKQGNYEEALELSERGRTHVLAKTLSKNKTPEKLSTAQMQAIAKEQNATLVEYSIIREPSYLNTKDYRLFIWVVQPDGQIHFRQVDSNSLAKKKEFFNFNLIHLFDGSTQSTAAIVILIIGIGLTSFLLFVQRRKKLALLAILGSSICFIPLLVWQSQVASNNPVQRSADNSVINVSNNSSDKDSSPQQFNVSLSDLVKNTLVTVMGEAEMISSEPLAQGSCQNREECLKQLHQLLVQPIEELLPSNPEEQVVFIPDSELFKISFASLQDQDGKYLIEKHTIRTTPSIRILQLLQQHKIAQQKSSLATKALVVGNPVMPSQVEVSVLIPDKSDYATLTALPSAEEEAKAVAQLLNTKAIVGKQATESLVVKEIPQAKILHFATHGVLGAEGDTGALIFTPSSKTDDCLDRINDGPLNPQEFDCVQRHRNDGLLKNDGLLNLSEIASLDINADLVVMSACETGLGHTTTDGVIGLVRSFLGGGVPSVVASLWTIPDAATSELMVEFYKNLQSNPDKARALRQAMLTTKDKYPEPFNWAAFTLVGEAR